MKEIFALNASIKIFFSEIRKIDERVSDFEAVLAQKVSPYSYKLFLATPSKHFSPKFCRKTHVLEMSNKICFRSKCYRGRLYKRI